MKNRIESQFNYRFYPIPGSQRWSSYRSIFRTIRTTNERRQYYASSFETGGYSVKIRPKRNPVQIPDSWEDYNRSNFADKCWKRFRKHQWKEIR